MTSIGSFGVDRPRVDLSFDYFGETIRVHPDASDLKAMNMILSIGDLDMDNEDHAPEIIAALKDQLFGQVHPEDQKRFWQLAMDNRQTRMDLLAITKAITEAIAGFPTQPHSDLPHTPTADDMNYGPASRQQRRALAREADKGNTRAALTLLQGRPDLQKVVLDRAEWLESQTG